MRLSTDTLPTQERDRDSRSLMRLSGQDDYASPALAERSSFFLSEEEKALDAQLRELLNVLAQGQAVQRTPQRLVITGVQTDTEASYLANNLALAAARSGYRVLLVDANFANPSVHINFGLSTKLGLSTLLSSPNPPHALPQATPVPNLAAITIGPDAANWSSLLNREQIFHRLQPLASSFDYMMIDCGNLQPVLVGRVSAGADNVVVAVKEHVSSMRELATIVDTLRSEGVQEPAILMVE
jgi:Mrp family chromosome partitioning ATPase